MLAIDSEHFCIQERKPVADQMNFGGTVSSQLFSYVAMFVKLVVIALEFAALIVVLYHFLMSALIIADNLLWRPKFKISRRSEA